MVDKSEKPRKVPKSRERLHIIYNIIRNLKEPTLNNIIKAAEKEKIDSLMVEEIIDQLVLNGKLIEPKPGFYKLVDY